jgi:hypothetical protein
MPEMTAARVTRRLKLSSATRPQEHPGDPFVSSPSPLPPLRKGDSESDKSDPAALNHVATLLKGPTARGFGRVLVNGHCSRPPREALALIGSSHGAGVPTLLRPAVP